VNNLPRAQDRASRADDCQGCGKRSSPMPSAIPARFTAHGCSVIVYDVFLAIAQLSYISGGPRSFWAFMGLLLTVVGFLIALWLIWVVLQWVVEKLRRK
jgi:hypothetical protein